MTKTNLKELWKLWKKKNGRKTWTRKIWKKSNLILLFFFLIFFALFFAISIIPRNFNKGEKIVFYIPKGSSALEIGHLLKEKNLIFSEFIFWFWCKILGVEERLKYGYYELSPRLSILEILKKLSRGDTLVIKVTIPEGLNLEDISYILSDKLNISREEFINLSKNPDKIRGIKKYFPEDLPSSLEGYLFPETYYFPRDVEEEYIILTMIDTFFKKINKEIPNWRKELEKKNFSLNDWVILASIVEKEGKLEEERPLIAGVFINRLKKGYKLQSCATVEYIFNFKKAILTYEDLKIDSPYNTYIYHGLPPTPISSPSLSSLKAVLYPEGDYLFFVSKGDGSHYFTKNYKEHLEFQKQKK
ncbi:MAG: endolytic transglycosylase MltG [Dictyoglomus sp.]|nr:endolytic transglycosylase MltG [Dictyoglomus sp.]MCX7942486.1 endolytic transglycosylase MltG [Dictyoglomaceae bacterium]MDW8187714.1 endolytic transglycosylase MltG [Dictyoglomus sp.]